MASPNAMIPAPALPILRFRVSSERKEPSVGGLGTVRGRCARATFGRRQSRGRGQRAAQVGRCLLPQDPTSFELPSVMSVMEHALFPLFPPALRGPFRLIMRTTFLYGNINPHFDENMLFREWSPLSTVLLLQRREPLRASEPGARGTGPCETSRPNPEVAVAEPLPNAQGASRGALRGIDSKNQLNLNLGPPTAKVVAFVS